MLTRRRIRRWLRTLFTPGAVQGELDEETRLHLELETAQLVRDGMDPAAARARAERDFGAIPRVAPVRLTRRTQSMIAGTWQDGWQAARGLRRTPGFTALAALTIALGIGATTAIFAAVHGILHAPLPYPDADRIVTVWQHDRVQGRTRDEVAAGNFIDWRERSRSFAAFAVAEPYSKDWLAPDGPTHLPTWLVTEGYFDALGTRAMLGRTLTADDYRPGASPTIVLGHAIWQRVFAGDPAILGRTVLLDSVPSTIVGVMPPHFGYPVGRDVYGPKVFTDGERERRRSAYMYAVGRLRPGASVASAHAELSTVATQLAREHPQTNADVGVTIVPLGEQLTGGVREALLVFLGAVGCVLLIACANVASLLLARATQRAREIAVRAALGAGRGRLARQLGAESLLLALVGGAGGLVVAHAMLGTIKRLAPPSLPRVDELHVGPAVLLFALASTLGTALVIGIAPALRSARADVYGALRGGRGTGGADPARRATQRGLLIGEFALALVLLVGAGLLTRSFVTLLQVERGFTAAGVHAGTVQAWGYYPTPESRAAYARAMEARLAALPGVQATGVTSALPLAEDIGATEAAVMAVGSATGLDSARTPATFAAVVSGGYFTALDIPLRRGRRFGAGDDAGAAPVAIVSESFARLHWPGREAVGQRVVVRSGPRQGERTVVGVVGDVRHRGLHEPPRPTLYVPHAQAPTGAMVFVVRSTQPAGLALAAMRRAFFTENAAMPLAQLTGLEELLASSLRERRFHLMLLGAFAVAAALLAAVGIYGLTSQVTQERTFEIGLRLALGATPGAVLRLVLGQGLVTALLGTALGALGAMALTRTLRGMLYGVSPLDPAAFVAGAALLALLAIAGCWAPGRRAASLDPIQAIRSE